MEYEQRVFSVAYSINKMMEGRHHLLQEDKSCTVLSLLFLPAWEQD